MLFRHPPLALFAIAGLVLGSSGCGKQDDPQPAQGSAHAAGAGGHAHEPKYGGQLVELGDHEGSVELVLDRTAGRLTLYALDAHAERFVRLPVASITIQAEAAGGPQTLLLTPVSNAATGEKSGDTSQFEATAKWLKSAPTVTGRILELPVKSKTYRDVTFRLPQ